MKFSTPSSLTSEQLLGTKFEYWVTKLLQDNEYSFVRQNVRYTNKEHASRQVDVEYREFPYVPASLSLVILELKYCSNGKVKLPLRKLVQKKGQLFSIDNIVEEAEERRRFVGARKAILLTNYRFEDEVYLEAQKFEQLEIKDGRWLGELEKRRNFVTWGEPLPMEEQIKKVKMS